MIVKIIEKPTAALSNILQYNEKESREGKHEGELLSTNLMGETWEERFDEFKHYLDKEKANPILHIPIRLAPSENLTNEQFTDLSLSYMTKMGLSPDKYPYQLIRHHDKKDGEHIHLVISRSSIDGVYWNPHQYQKRSSKARQELEDKYELQRLSGNKFSQDRSLKEINMFEFGGKTSSRTFAKEKLTSILSTHSPENKMDISEFVQTCKEANIHPIFNLQNEGEKIAGVSFFVNSHYGSHTFKGSQVGCSWNDIKNSLAHFPEDKNFLQVANRISLENSLSDASNLPKDIELKKSLVGLVNLSADNKPSENFIKSINSLKLTPVTRKSLNTFLSQHEKGRGEVTPFVYATQLIDAKASNREYSLFDWEIRNNFKDKKIHAQATRFLIENKENPKAFSWILRYPPVSTKNISLRSHLDSFDFHDNQKQFNRLKSEQFKKKTEFCDTFGIEATSRRRFMNTPLPPKQFDKLNSIMDNIHPNSPKEAFAFAHKTTENYSTFLREKIGEVCVHSGASPIASQTLYDKFLFSMEKHDLDHTLLNRFYGLSQKDTPALLATKDIDVLVDRIEQKSNFGNNTASGFFEELFSKLGELPSESCYEPREPEAIRKRKKRRMPNH